MIVCTFLLLSFNQRGDARLNISRVFLESPVTGLLGYCSYTLYILQRIMLEWWYPFIWASMILGHPQVNFPDVINPQTGQGFNNGMSWFNNHEDRWKVLMILCLIVICYGFQKFFQDMFIVWSYGKLSSLSCWSKCRAAVVSILPAWMSSTTAQRGGGHSTRGDTEVKTGAGTSVRASGSYSNLASASGHGAGRSDL